MWGLSWLNGIQQGQGAHVSQQTFHEQAETDVAWRAWFVLPHLRDPTRDPQFHVFFSSSWADTLRGRYVRGLID